MSIIKKFKDYFNKGEGVVLKPTPRNISYNKDALMKMEDKVRDIFFGSIEDCDEFDIEYKNKIDGVFMELRFRYHDLLYEFKTKSDRALKIEKDVNKGIKKLILEYNIKDKRVVNADAPEFLFSPHHNLYKTEYVLNIWRYKTPNEKMNFATGRWEE